MSVHPLLKVTAVALFSVLFFCRLYAQKLPEKTNVSKTDTTKTDSTKKKLTQRAKSIFFEAGGPGLFSFNYDTRILNTANGLGVRIGIGDLPIQQHYHIPIPVQLNYLIGSKTDYVELGLGATMLFFKHVNYQDYFPPNGGVVTESILEKRFSIAATATIGYRYQPVTSGFNFRIGFTPAYAFSQNDFTDPRHIVPFGGVSFGYTFKHFQPVKGTTIDTNQESAYWSKGGPLKKKEAVPVSETDSLKPDSAKKIRRAKNVFVELGGPGLLSLNYDQRFLPKRDGFGFRAGLGVAPTSGSPTLSIPLQLNYLWGKKDRFLEVGAGITIAYYYPDFAVRYTTITTPSGQVVNNVPYETYYSRSFTVLTTTFEAATTTFAYRYQPAKGGINFRAGISPTLILNKEYLFFDVNRFQVLPELSIGYTFKR